MFPLRMITFVEGCWYFGDTLCSIHSAFDMILTTVSIFHLICIALDRYQAVCNPLYYSTRITIPVAWFMSALSWITAGLYGFSLLYSQGNVKGLEDSSIKCLGSCFIYVSPLWAVFDAVISFFLPCLVMIGFYTKIFFVAREHLRKIEDMNHKIQKEDTEEIQNKLSQSSQRKAAKTLGIVMGAFIFCWMPFFLLSIIDTLTNYATPFVVFELFLWLGYINST